MPPPPQAMTMNSVVEQVEDGVGLDDLLGIGGSDDATPAAAGILDEDLGGILGHELLGLFLGVEGADRLGRVLERGIIRVALDLGDDGGGVPTLIALVHLAADALLQVITNVALGHGAALGQRHLGGTDGIVGSGEGVLDHADLRAVAVGDDDLVALPRSGREERERCCSRPSDLPNGVVAEGVAAKGNDDTIGLAKRLRHCWNPFSKATTH